MPTAAEGRITHFSWSDRPEEVPPADVEDEASSAEEVVDPAAAYREAHITLLGEISKYLLAIVIALLIVAAIMLLGRVG
jgi:hypothetical protein